MLTKTNNYENLYNNFRWSIPSHYNIAKSTIDKQEYQNRTALIHISNNGSLQVTDKIVDHHDLCWHNPASRGTSHMHC